MEQSFHIFKLKDPDTSNEVMVYFESESAAEQFVTFFKNRVCLEGIADQIYHPYYISLRKYGEQPIDIFKCDGAVEFGAVRDEEHNVCFYSNSGSEQGLFISKLFARSEVEALRKAIGIRDGVVGCGDWALAWDRHLALNGVLDRKGSFSSKSRFI